MKPFISWKLHQRPLDPNHFRNASTVVYSALIHTPTHPINTYQAEDNAW